MKYKPRKFNIKYTATINSASNNEVRVWIAQPVTSSLQKIIDFSIYPKPDNYYIDKFGNKILYFRFKNQKNINIKMNIGAILWKEKIDIRKQYLLLSVPNKFFSQFTKSEKFLRQTKKIKKVVEQITKNDKNTPSKIKSLFNFVTNNFKYCYPVKQRGAEYLNLRNLKGDCAEYSGLFVTMCRILKIPSKNETGFVIFPKHKKIVEHGWASIYIKPYGWVDIDAQYASLEKNVNKRIEKYLGQRNDYKIIFTNGFNIPVKPTIPHGFNLNYWEKNGLSISNNSVQTLQPLIFASSSKKINFKDSIDLNNKKP